MGPGRGGGVKRATKERPKTQGGRGTLEKGGYGLSRPGWEFRV